MFFFLKIIVRYLFWLRVLPSVPRNWDYKTYLWLAEIFVVVNVFNQWYWISFWMYFSKTWIIEIHVPLCIHWFYCANINFFLILQGKGESMINAWPMPLMIGWQRWRSKSHVATTTSSCWALGMGKIAMLALQDFVQYSL